MALSPNYGWSEPDNSSLVKNGAQDIRALGDAIDTSLWNVGFGQAGKNKVINGNFGIWQRGTSSFTNGGLTADRWYYYGDGTGTRAVTQQTFTPGTAPVAGYEGKYFWRMTQSVAGTGGTLNITWQRIEDVQTFAGQTITVSFWAKADAARTISIGLNQNFGSGGSSAVAITGTNFSATTAWTRFSYTVAIPSIAGKTVGTSSYFEIQIGMPLNVVQTIDIWGVQAEIGSVATGFQTATGTIQGELAACQRYYERRTAQGVFFGMGFAGRWSSTTSGIVTTTFASPKRVNPSVAMSNLIAASAGSNLSVTSVAGVYGSGQANGVVAADIAINVASGATSGYATTVFDSGFGNGYIEFSAEL